MSSGIWTKAMIQNQKDLGTNLCVLFPVSSLNNYVYIEKDILSYSHNKYMYTMYTSPEVIQDNIAYDFILIRWIRKYEGLFTGNVSLIKLNVMLIDI